MNSNDKYTRSYVESKGRLFPDSTVGPVWTETKAMGIPIYVRNDDASVGPCLIKDGFWESWITTWFLNNLKEGATFIDVGANTGYYSFLARHAGMKVTAYEPNPKYVEMIRASQKIGWDQTRGDWQHPNHFDVQPYAVSNEVGTVTLTIPDAFQGSATIRTDAIDETLHPSSHINVMTVNLDYHWASFPKRDLLIKVDAEGAEELVWEGAQRINMRHRPVWMMEYTPGAYSERFLDDLENYGDLAWINYAGEAEPITKGGILTATDWLMLVIRPRS